MNIRISSSLVCVSLSSLLSAQDASVTSYDWDHDPKLDPAARIDTQATVFVTYNTITDWELEEDALVEYFLIHVRAAINTESSVEENNKVYVAMSGVESVPMKKARVITPAGKVVELDAEDFKEQEDDEDHERSIYFAFEGLEVGSEIEYIIVLKQGPDLRGDREMFQKGSTILSRSIDIICPEHLVLAHKSYNGAPDLMLDSTRTDARQLHAEMKMVPALKNEDSSAPSADGMQVVFALDRNTGGNLRDYCSYTTATRVYYDVLYPDMSKVAKDIKKLEKQMDLATAANEEEKVRRIENYLKSNYQVVNVGADVLSDLPSILKNKIANNTGMVILTCAVLKQFGIDHQLVVTSDRQNLRFDKAFEAWNFLQEVFIYFPQFKKYMAPAEFEMRLGFIPAEYMDNYGLFIRTVDVGGIKSGVGKVQHIDPVPYSANGHDMIIGVDLAAEPGMAVIDFENKMTGYFASGVQPTYRMLDEENQKELLEQLVDHVFAEGDEKTITITNDEAAKFPLEPLLINVKTTTAKFNETAGDKMLFKVGELIGPQVEMYDEKNRKLPVDDAYTRQFMRTITITLPADMKVDNLDKLKINKELVRDGKAILRFHSDYVLNGNVLTVTVEEYYQESLLPVSDFEGYRSVVNAAADFNKVVLVLKKI